MKLLTSQKNKLFEVIESRDLSPNMFLYQEPTSASGNTTIRFKDSNFFYTFSENVRGGHSAYFSPGNEKLHESANPHEWSRQILYFQYWLVYLKREITQTDKWAILEEELKKISFQDLNYDSNKFTHEEFMLLENNIRELKNKITKLDLLEDQVDIINQKLDHLLQLAENMNKTDWKELFIGSLFSLTMQLTVDRELGQTIFSYVKEQFFNFIPQLK